MLPQSNRRLFVVTLWLMFIGMPAVSVQGEKVRAKVGDPMPSFTLPDLKEGKFTYPASGKNVTVIIFLSDLENQAEKVNVDLDKLMTKFQAEPVRWLPVVTGHGNKDYLRDRWQGNKMVTVLQDPDYDLWGKLGLIATPTVVVVDKEGVIRWVRAGHRYDFEPALRDEIAEVLGLEHNPLTNGGTEVTTLNNSSLLAKTRRHIRMAQMFTEKGRMETAVSELKKAEALMPDSTEVLIELATAHCRAAQNKEALAVVQRIKPSNRFDESSVKMLSGWAHRQMGDYVQAEKLLGEAVNLNPKSARAHYELGKMYQKQAKPDKAMESYRRALSIVFQEPLPPLKKGK
jgi:hypothetical protein